MRLHSAFAPLAVLAFVALTSSRGDAQARADFSTARYRPAVGPGNYLMSEGAQTGAHLQLSYGFAFDYARDPLRIDRPCRELGQVTRCEKDELSFVHQSALAHVLVGLSLQGHTQLSLDVPFGGSDGQPLEYSVMPIGTASPYRELKPRDGFAIGDARLLGKRRLYGDNDGPLRIAIAAFTTVPTARITSRGDCRDAGSCSYLGERSVAAGGFAVVEYAPHARLRLASNVGAHYRPKRDFLGVQTGSELSFSAAGAYELVRRLWLKAELVGALAFRAPDDVPLEARAGLSYGRDLVWTLGGGAGVLGELGSPRYRILAGVQWTPVFHDADRDGLADGRDRCPSASEDRDGFEDGDGCPELDNDRDGVPDTRDGCDDQAEDRDGFADDDGCPELDNDGDGVPDGYDTCEGEKEDVDGDHDDDGCPDVDRDRDGLLDDADQCIDEAEDMDGLADDDGCPEEDHDGDSVPDVSDACPDEPAPVIGQPDDDGCP
jgi:hypothetical protein